MAAGAIGAIIGFSTAAGDAAEPLGASQQALSHQGDTMSVEELDTHPLPFGELALQTIAMPKDTNANGDIFGGWLLSQMDLAGSITASELAEGRVATVAIEGMSFLTPVHVGAVVSCYCDVLERGRSSVRILVEVWINAKPDGEPLKVTEGEFIYVAIDENKLTRPIPQ
jgi:acyl-CoA thioesterase YciA